MIREEVCRCPESVGGGSKKKEEKREEEVVGVGGSTKYYCVRGARGVGRGVVYRHRCI